MKHEAINSSVLKSIGHENGILEVMFKNDKIYQYVCPEEVYINMLKSESPGKFYTAYVKSKYYSPEKLKEMSEKKAILINGSMNFTLMLEKAKAGHSAFKKAENGNIYVNITEWINEEPNSFGQHSSILLNSAKDHADKAEKVYIGNGKKVEFAGEGQLLDSKAAAAIPAADDLPF